MRSIIWTEHLECYGSRKREQWSHEQDQCYNAVDSDLVRLQLLSPAEGLTHGPNVNINADVLRILHGSVKLFASSLCHSGSRWIRLSFKWWLTTNVISFLSPRILARCTTLTKCPDTHHAGMYWNATQHQKCWKWYFRIRGSHTEGGSPPRTACDAVAYSTVKWRWVHIDIPRHVLLRVPSRVTKTETTAHGSMSLFGLDSSNHKQKRKIVRQHLSFCLCQIMTHLETGYAWMSQGSSGLDTSDK